MKKTLFILTFILISPAARSQYKDVDQKEVRKMLRIAKKADKKGETFFFYDNDSIYLGTGYEAPLEIDKRFYERLISNDIDSFARVSGDVFGLDRLLFSIIVGNHYVQPGDVLRFIVDEAGNVILPRFSIDGIKRELLQEKVLQTMKGVWEPTIIDGEPVKTLVVIKSMAAETNKFYDNRRWFRTNIGLEVYKNE